MPTYTNTSEAAAMWPGKGLLAAGTKIATLKYVTDLQAGWELTAHTPYPKTPSLKFGSTLPSSAITGLSGYSQLQISNESGGVIVVEINGDTANALRYPDGVIVPIDNDCDIEEITISGDGTGNAYLWGVPR